MHARSGKGNSRKAHITLPHLEYEALEVAGFGDAPEHGVVRRLAAGVHFAQAASGIARGIEDHIPEHGGGHVL